VVEKNDVADEWLEAQIEMAARAMSGELGDSSVCTVHKDGRVTGGLKYHEGRMSAFAELRRLWRRGVLDDAVLAEVESRWAGESSTRGKEHSSPLWVSYATGGVDAVGEARAALFPHLAH
jgi:hypothetical protein